MPNEVAHSEGWLTDATTGAHIGALAVDRMYDMGVPQSGDYLDPDGSSINTTAVTAGNLRVGPMVLTRRITVATIGVEITSGNASAVVRLGVYADNGTGYPGTLIFEAPSTIDGSATGFMEVAVTGQTLGRGLYWLGCAAQTANVTFRSSINFGQPLMHFRAGTDTNNHGYQMASTAALPATFAAIGTSTLAAACPRTMLKVA